jgi:hypothetical protein
MLDGMTWEEYCDYIDYLDSRACALNIPDLPEDVTEHTQEKGVEEDSDAIPF